MDPHVAAPLHVDGLSDAFKEISDTHDYSQSLQQPCIEQKGVTQLLQIEEVQLNS